MQEWRNLHRSRLKTQPVRRVDPAPSRRRRRIYIKERLPAVLAEMKSLTDEKKEFTATRNQGRPEERRQVNRRLNFLVERLAVLREERAALIEESRQYAQLAKEEEKE
jgi:hypothetical protein